MIGDYHHCSKMPDDHYIELEHRKNGWNLILPGLRDEEGIPLEIGFRYISYCPWCGIDLQKLEDEKGGEHHGGTIQESNKEQK